MPGGSDIYLSIVIPAYSETGSQEILEVLEENYYLVGELSYPSEIGQGSVYIYLPRQQ